MAVEKKAPVGQRQRPGNPKNAPENRPPDYRRARGIASEEQSKYEDDIQTLHEMIDRVKLGYHLYFIGTNPQPPRDDRLKLDRLARYSQQHMPSRTMERFKMQSALIRYTHFCELWDKSIRKLESGERIPWVAISRQLEEEEKKREEEQTPPAPPRPESSPELARVTRPMEEPDEVRKIYNSYMVARKKTGDQSDVPFEKFLAAIAKQTEQILGKSAAVSVQYRIEIVDNKVAIKAKPLRQDAPDPGE